MDSPVWPGKGLASSSQAAVLNAVLWICLVMELLRFEMQELIQIALSFERGPGGRKLAGADVPPIAFGGTVAVHTDPRWTRPEIRPIVVEPGWTRRHLVLLLRPSGVSHIAEGLLESLFAQPNRAREFIPQITSKSYEACEALQRKHPRLLGATLSSYRELFNYWAEDALILPSLREHVMTIQDALRDDLYGWSFCGAGRAESALLVVKDAAAAIKAAARDGWIAIRICPTAGVTWDVEGYLITVHAGLRLPFIAVADLGCEPAFSQFGVCVGMAIGRRRRLFIECEPLCECA
jgi:hypothetical protein